MTSTFSNSDTPAAVEPCGRGGPGGSAPRGPASPAPRLPSGPCRSQAARAATPGRPGATAAGGAAGPAVETRAYFRCDRLDATLSVQQCRANRERLTPHEALALPFDLPPWWVQPLPCWSCTLAPLVEAARVPFFSAEQVLAGHARNTRSNSHSRPRLH